MEQLRRGDPEQVGPYRVLSRLGSGAMGRVFLAESDGTPVALKVIQPGLAEEQQFRARFRQEVRAAQRVTGPHTAAVLDADPDGEPAWMATEYVPGPTLQQLVDGEGPLPLTQVSRLAAEIAAALTEIHDAGVVHRDLKPTNVVVPLEGPLRVIDFGVARAADATFMTATGLAVGSVGYMSPEQVTGDTRVGPATDVFALGVLLHYAATGDAVFGTGSSPSVMYRVVHNQPDLSAVANSNLRSLIAACLAKDPSERPSADVIRAACANGSIAWGASASDPRETVSRPTPTLFRPPLRVSQPESEPVENAHRSPRRKVQLLAAAALVVLAVGTSAWLLGGQPAISSTPAGPAPTAASITSYSAPSSIPAATSVATTPAGPTTVVVTPQPTVTTTISLPPPQPQPTQSANPGTTAPPSLPTFEPSNAELPNLTVDGTMDKATVKALQRVLNDKYGQRLEVDGVVGKLTRSALQRVLGVPVTGKRDPRTTAALQRHIGATVDGKWGHETTRMLQRALNEDRF